MRKLLLLPGLLLLTLARDARAADCYIQLQLNESADRIELGGMTSRYGDYGGEVQGKLPGYRADRLLQVYSQQGQLRETYVVRSQRTVVAENFEKSGSSGRIYQSASVRTSAMIPWQDDLGRVTVESDGRVTDLGTVNPQSLRCERSCRRDNESVPWGAYCCNGLMSLKAQGQDPVCRRCGDRVCSAGENALCPSDCRVRASSHTCYPGLTVDYGCGDLAGYYSFDGSIRNSARRPFLMKTRGKVRYEPSALGNQAVALRGSTGMVMSGWRTSGPGSISLWFRPQRTDGSQVLFAVNDWYGTGYTVSVNESRQLQLQLAAKNRKVQAASTGKSGGRVKAATSGKSRTKIKSGWNHVALVREMAGRQWRLYLNGKSVVLLKIGSSLTFRRQSTVMIGAVRTRGAAYNSFTGQLDNLSVWYRGLSAASQGVIFSSAKK